MQSILTSTKKILGLDETYTVFDHDITTFINGAFSSLHQLGVGPKNGFFIEDSTAIWTDFLQSGPLLSLVKSYVYLKVRLLFDPPTTSFLIEATNQQIQEHEFRISIYREGDKNLNYPASG